MDDLFGVTELVRKLDDVERNNSLPDAAPVYEKDGGKNDQVEVAETK
jgi:hypothetical protein